jgi:hypothetical protein
MGDTSGFVMLSKISATRFADESLRDCGAAKRVDEFREDEVKGKIVFLHLSDRPGGIFVR